MSEFFNQIMSEYEDLRAKKENEKDARIVKIYKEYPDIEKIDREIYLSGAENVKSIIKFPEKSDELNRRYKDKLKLLKKERAEIIEKNGIDNDFDKIKYDCEKCSDTGFLKNGEKCECLKKRLIYYNYINSNLSQKLEKENFETFSFEYYSKEKRGEYKSPYENMKIIYGRAVKFCENFENEEKGLLFYGDTGLGKTFLSSCIAKKIIDSGKSVIYLSASKLFSIYDDYRFNRGRYENVIDDIYSSDLLIIDDLGTEPKTEANRSFLFDLMNDRFIKNKKIIINTNYNMGELTRHYTQRFTSRIYEFFLVYGFYGNDIRIEKLKK